MLTHLSPAVILASAAFLADHFSEAPAGSSSASARLRLCMLQPSAGALKRAGDHTLRVGLKGRQPATTSKLLHSCSPLISPDSLHLPNPILYSLLPFLHLSFGLPTPNLILSLSSTTTHSFQTQFRKNVLKKWRGRRKKKRVEIRKWGKLKHLLPPRLVSAPHHGSSWFLLSPLVIHRVHKLKDVRRTKLEGGA